MSGPGVLHVFKYFRPRFTGEGVFVERLAPVFARLRPDVRHEVLVTATPRPEGLATLFGLDRVHYLSRTEAGSSQQQIIAWLGRHGRRYDVVHHHTHVDRTFLGNLALKLQGCRVLLSATLDDSIFGLLGTYRPSLRPLVRRLFQLVDAFVAISPKLFEENSRYVGSRKSTLVPIGIATPEATPCGRAAARAELGLPARGTILVTVGGICRRKDQRLLVEQLPDLLQHDPNLMLVLVGPVLEPD
ncbi:MAG: glycosyltransferase, partial [Phenylobacterium sp.]|nr:glycosyltransferase [Phenylobacterium sp.]